MKLSRRQLLAGSASLALPTLLLPRAARAATRARGAAEHVLVLFAKGGFRSHATFNAVGTRRDNPWGAQPAAPGTEWALGAAVGAEDYTTTLGVVPAFARQTREVAVIPCVDHTPGERTVDVDHRTALNRIATGAPEGKTGLLSIVGRLLPRYAQGFSATAFPPVELGATEFGLGAGDYAQARPLSLTGAEAVFRSDTPVGQGWRVGARAALDQRFRERRSRAFRQRLSEFIRAKGYAVELAGLLTEPTLDVRGQPMARDAGVSNAELLSVLGDYGLSTLGDLEDPRSWGADVALALRFFGLGAPMCVVTRDMYDLHDRERENYAPRATDLVRQLAGLRFLLPRMSHPKGGTYWDKTLVVVLSEFSRNNTGDEGFNSGNGSDHVSERSGPARNQAIAVMGGMVSAAGKRLGATDDAMNALGPVYSSRSLLATLLDVLGVDASTLWADAPIQELFT